MGRNALKLLAIFAMLCDHVAFAFVPAGTAAYVALRAFGRLAAPIMAFFIAEGCRHTHDLTRYALRLLCTAIVSQPIYSLFVTDGQTAFLPRGNILFTLLLALGALHFCRKARGTVPLALCFFGSLVCDWSFFPLLFALAFSMFYGDRKKTWLAYFLVCAAYAALSREGIGGLYRLGVFAAAPLLLAYNGKAGKQTALARWGFYLFYPAHLLVIAAIQHLC